jgi:hypothetical protein
MLANERPEVNMTRSYSRKLSHSYLNIHVALKAVAHIFGAE